MKTYEDALQALSETLSHAYASTVTRRRWDNSDETSKREGHAFDTAVNELVRFTSLIYGKTTEQVIDDLNELDGCDFQF